MAGFCSRTTTSLANVACCFCPAQAARLGGFAVGNPRQVGRDGEMVTSRSMIRVEGFGKGST